MSIDWSSYSDPPDCTYCGVGLAGMEWEHTVEPQVQTEWHASQGTGVEVGDTAVVPSGDRRWRTCDHVVPRCRGGTDDRSNLVPSCMKCNSSKGTKDVDVWMSEVAA